jgi:thiol-disulfide isomerase/thioredoxin
MRLLAAIALFTLCAGPSSPTSIPEVRNRSEIQKSFSSSAKLRVVNLWATWCVPCVAEMPDLQAIDEKFADRDVQIIGVSLDDAIPGEREDRKNLVRKFLTKSGVRFKILYYLGNTNKLADEYDYNAEIPITFVFDASGRELMRHQGVIDPAKFTSDLQSLLRKEKP